MAKRQILAGATDQTIDVFIQDSSSTTGAGLAGLAYNSAGLTCYYRKGATGTPTALTLATQTVGGAHSDGGFVAVDGTNCPGQYRLDLSDTIVATAGISTLYLKGATNMAPCIVELEISDATTSSLKILADAIKAKTDNLPTDPADASDLAAALAALNDVSLAEINNEFLDVLATDTHAEITGVPGYPASIQDMIRRMYAALINPIGVTSSKKQFKNAAGTAQWEKDLSDDGTTYAESAGNAP